MEKRWLRFIKLKGDNVEKYVNRGCLNKFVFSVVGLIVIGKITFGPLYEFYATSVALNYVAK